MALLLFPENRTWLSHNEDDVWYLPWYVLRLHASPAVANMSLEGLVCRCVGEGGTEENEPMYWKAMSSRRSVLSAHAPKSFTL